MEGRLHRKDSGDNKMHEADGGGVVDQQEEQPGGMKRSVSNRTTTKKKNKKHQNKATTRGGTPSNDVTNIDTARTTRSSSATTSNTTRKQKKKKLTTPTTSTNTQRATNSGERPRQYEKECERGDEEDALWNDLVIGDTTHSNFTTASENTSAAHARAVIKKKKKKTRISRQPQRHQLEQNRPTPSLLAAPEAVPSINGSEHEPDTFEQEFVLEATNQHPDHNDNASTMPSLEGTHPAVGAFAVHGDQILPREAHLSTHVSDMGFSTIDDDHADSRSHVFLPEAELVVPPADEPPKPNAPLVQADALSHNFLSKPRNRFIVLGVVAVLVVALVVAVTMSLANPNPTEPTSHSPPTNAPTFLPTPAPSPAPVALLPDGPWKTMGQELGGKADDYFGSSVFFSRDARVLVVGATQRWTGRPGYVSVFELDDSTGSWVAKGQELIGEANDDWFGCSVALNGDGTILAVGAPWNDGGGEDAGHVRVFQHDTSANRWVQLGSDIDGERAWDQFGDSVSLSKAGDILAAGARHGSYNFRGSVRTFQYDRENDSWDPLGQTLVGQAASDDFGYSVSLSGSGGIVAVGARGNDSRGTDAGQVSIYQYNSASLEWVAMGSPINGRVERGHFGSSVSLDDSGMVVAVGGSGGDHRVLVYSYGSSTSTWVQRGQTLEDQEPDVYFLGDSGDSVSLSGNGNVLAVENTVHDANGLENSGQVTIFQYNTNTMEWDTVGEPLNGKAALDVFVTSVSLSEDGTVVAVGADRRDYNGNTNSGSASVYNLN